jgi:hypothetical protein
MALITPVAAARGSYTILRNATAQANTGQTDWVPVPDWAIYAEVYLNVSAVAGTTPILTPSFLAVDPVTYDDTYSVQLHAAFTTPPTAASFNVIYLGPGVSPADDVALSATSTGFGSVNIPLPVMLGCKLLLDRGSADETYTYTYALKFRR